MWSPIPQRTGGVVKWSTRVGTRPRAIVIHRMDGSLEGSDSWLKSPKSGSASTHFGVGLWNGTPQVRQWVDTAFSAFGWAATPTDTPTAVGMSVFKDRLVRYGSYPYWRSTSDLNRDVIAIEVEGFASQSWNPAVILKVKQLIAALIQHYGPLWIVAHTDMSTKPCPGMYTFLQALPGYYGKRLGSTTPQSTEEQVEMAFLDDIESTDGRWFTVKEGIVLRRGPGTGYPEHFTTEHPTQYWLHGFHKNGWAFATRSPTTLGFFFVPPKH